MRIRREFVILAPIVALTGILIYPYIHWGIAKGILRRKIERDHPDFIKFDAHPYDLGRPFSLGRYYGSIWHDLNTNGAQSFNFYSRFPAMSVGWSSEKRIGVLYYCYDDKLGDWRSTWRPDWEEEVP